MHTLAISRELFYKLYIFNPNEMGSFKKNQAYYNIKLFLKNIFKRLVYKVDRFFLNAQFLYKKNNVKEW